MSRRMMRNDNKITNFVCVCVTDENTQTYFIIYAIIILCIG